MKIIRDIFDQTRPIDRPITSVINYAGATEDQLEREIREYEVTDSLARHYERLLNNLADGFSAGAGHEIGVWVSGFYGSGKSSFTKYLGFAFDPKRKLKGDPFLKWLQNQFPGIQLRQQLSTVANRFPATVIMLDLAAVASVQSAAQGVSRLVYDEVMAWAGYSKDEKLALLELLLEKDGKLEAFKKRFQEVAKGRSWDSLKNDLLLGVTFASRIVSEFYPEIWPDAKTFNDTKISARYGEDERVRQMLGLIDRRSGSKRAIFIIDEVGQFIEGSPQLILNMQGLAENLKNLGFGHAWLITTAQQTLPVTGPLFKLKDRFPESRRVDIESSDIREITYRRLLRKSPAADELLRSLYKEKEGGLLHATDLKNTKLFQSTLTADAFVRLYPFLPQHFSLLMELLRSLARSTGGIGLRSAIKVIQDVLVDVSGYRSGHKLLADAPIGALATADVFYDTLRRDIERANRQLVETVDRVGEIFGADSLHLRVAKTIVVLQFIEGFPVSRENVAALLYPNLQSAPVTAAVDQAVNDMLAEKGLPLTEIDGSLRFMSEAVSQIMSEKSLLQPSSADSNRILSDLLREILTPDPSALVEGTLKVRVQTKLVQGSMPMPISHEKSEIELHLEIIPPAELAATQTARINDSRVLSNQHIIYLTGEDSAQIRDLIKEIYQCEEIHLRHRAEAAEKEVADFVRAQGQRAGTLKGDLDTALQNAFLKGSFVFRGRPQAVATRGTELLAACKSQVQFIAADVYHRFKEAPENVDSNLAERLLQTKDLSTVAAALDPLSLVQRRGNATRINDAHPALVAILDHLKKHGEVDGRKLLDDFGRALFGWFKDTARYIVAALLIAGRVRIRVASQWIKVSGEKAIEGLKNSNAFGKVDVATNEETVSQDTLLRAATRLLDVTGQNILPMPQNVSRGVQEHFPKFQRDYASLAAELTAAGLPGAERTGRLQKQLSQVLQGDASEAPTVLGAEECELIDNLIWAREVRKAFDQKLDDTALAAGELLREIPRLPRIGAAEILLRESETLRTELAGFLEREDFFAVGADIRNRLQNLNLLVKAGAELLTGQFTKELDLQRDAIRSTPVWASLPEADRAAFSQNLDTLDLGTANDLEGMRALVNRKLEADSLLANMRLHVEKRAKEVAEAKAAQPPPTPDAPTAPSSTPSTHREPARIKARRRYESGAEV
ncbi:MAG: BREX system P-loop protein BrxC [Verrucomicrobia bacterium]|nr:BREX system P-loop protein BrxC [Verrucomicrobiota bacterium]